VISDFGAVLGWCHLVQTRCIASLSV